MAGDTKQVHTRTPTARQVKHPAQTRQVKRTRHDATARARPPSYDVRAIETKWRNRWEQTRQYQVDLERAEHPYLNLMMFPYPSAEGLHAGNMFSYVGSDVHGRWMSMRGYDVFEPIGFDAFGIHSENFAIRQGIHPRVVTERNIAHFREQLQRVGNRFDWSHEVNSSQPDYYRWTQWIFVKLFKAGLVERRCAAVNWCPKDKTVLADEQVIDGRCERCGTVVERRELEQWFLKITHYAERLLDNLSQLDWSEKVVALQRAWIGRSQGLQFELAVERQPEARISVYTTRPDTIFGVTFVVLAPEHPLVDAITSERQRAAVAAYQEHTRRTQVMERITGEGEASGAFTGAYAIHPMTGERVPIWISDYVLMEYGTGAIMAVPAHDERDNAFARGMGLPIRSVVRPVETGDTSSEVVFTDDGVLIASAQFDGMASSDAREAIGAEIERRGIGTRTVKYHLRDWLISRQRYWGPPIPVIYCPDHGAVPVPEDQLPVLLPEVEDFLPTGTGTSPLAQIESFVQTTCPVCGKPARRETDVSDNFLDSAWYFLRYPSTGDDTEPWNPEMTRKWLPAKMYIGGAEHSVLHLMYSRFITMALHDLGYLDFEEPFPRFRANGMITREGGKMSKSRGNVIDPDDYMDRYGADVFRTYLLFMGPYDAGGDFSDRGIGGVVRFFDRAWSFVGRAGASAARRAPDPMARYRLHDAIRRVTNDIAALKYNTAIAALMKYLNELDNQAHVTREEVRGFVTMLAPFAPHLTEELWAIAGSAGSVHAQSWPEADAEALIPPSATIVVQVNGKVRDHIQITAGDSEDDITARALDAARIRALTAGRTVRQVIHVPGRLVNVVIE